MDLSQFKTVTIDSDDEYWAARAELAPIMFEADPDSPDGMRAEMLLNLAMRYEAENPDLDYGRSDPLISIVEAIMSLAGGK